jgi:hypothetical protein
VVGGRVAVPSCAQAKDFVALLVRKELLVVADPPDEGLTERTEFIFSRPCARESHTSLCQLPFSGSASSHGGHRLTMLVDLLHNLAVVTPRRQPTDQLPQVALDRYWLGRARFPPSVLVASERTTADASVAQRAARSYRQVRR